MDRNDLVWTAFRASLLAPLLTGGIDGLTPKRRSDRGQAQQSHFAKIQRAIELKREGPHRSDHVINRILKSEYGSGLASSTLYRHLGIQGATRKRLGFQKEKVRCLWTRDAPDALWMGDFSHGPIVMYHGELGPNMAHPKRFMPTMAKTIMPTA